MLCRLNRLLWKLRRRIAYRAYLRSDHWRGVREIVMRRTGGMCSQGGCKERARDVHHDFYRANLFDTRPEDCTPLCKKHHVRADKKRVRQNRQRWKARAK